MALYALLEATSHALPTCGEKILILVHLTEIHRSRISPHAPPVRSTRLRKPDTASTRPHRRSSTMPTLFSKRSPASTAGTTSSTPTATPTMSNRRSSRLSSIPPFTSESPPNTTSLHPSSPPANARFALFTKSHSSTVATTPADAKSYLTAALSRSDREHAMALAADRLASLPTPSPSPSAATSPRDDAESGAHQQFGVCADTRWRYISENDHGVALAKPEAEEPSYFIVITTYLSYLLLISVGHMRDYFGKKLYKADYRHLVENDVSSTLNVIGLRSSADIRLFSRGTPLSTLISIHSTRVDSSCAWTTASHDQ